MLSAVTGTKRLLRAADKSYIYIVTVISTRQEDRQTSAHSCSQISGRTTANSDILARVHVSFHSLKKQNKKTPHPHVHQQVTGS